MNLLNLLSSKLFIGIYVVILLVQFIWLFLLVLRVETKSVKNKPDRVRLVPSETPPVIVAPAVAPASVKKEEEEKKENAPRFSMLGAIDGKMARFVPPAYHNDVTLSELCESFRNFAASKLKLYYDISDVRRFIANMTVTHILIMQGMSGTGKTSMAYAFGQFMKNASTIIPIQPMWKERTDMIGYYNEFTKRFNESDLLQKMYEAGYNDQMYIVVLDEMNIARVEYYFAEFLSLLEIPDPKQRRLEVVSDVWENDPKHLEDGKILLPTNMWFIGTANNDDSTFAISDKVYDRAMVMNLDKKAEFFDPHEEDACPISATHFAKLAASARAEYGLTARNRRRLNALDKYLMKQFKVTVGNRIMRQINDYVPAYIACGGDELEALDDILAKKLFRKFEALNPISVRAEIGNLYAYLDNLFGENKLPICKDYLRKFEKTA